MAARLPLGKKKARAEVRRRRTLKKQLARLLGHKRLVRPRFKLPLGNVPFPIQIYM